MFLNFCHVQRKKQEEIYLAHFGYHVPPMIEELLNGYGHMNMQMGQTDRAYMFFKMNVHYYPKSANAYDSMAGYYEAQNDIPNALKFAQRAAELSDNEYYKTRIQEIKNK